MWWTIPVVVLWAFIWVGIPLILEYCAERKEKSIKARNHQKIIFIKRGENTVRIDVKSEQKKFWSIFDEKLIENGEPFSILHEKSGEVTYYAVVNKKHSFVDNALSIDFLVGEQKLRINIYVCTDLALFGIFERNKEEIETIVGMPLKWVKGTRNKNTRRIAYEIPVKTGNCSNYGEVIDQALPVVDKMKNVCELYAKHEFFDF